MLLVQTEAAATVPGAEARWTSRAGTEQLQRLESQHGRTAGWSHRLRGWFDSCVPSAPTVGVPLCAGQSEGHRLLSVCLTQSSGGLDVGQRLLLLFAVLRSPWACTRALGTGPRNLLCIPLWSCHWSSGMCSTLPEAGLLQTVGQDWTPGLLCPSPHFPLRVSCHRGEGLPGTERTKGTLLVGLDLGHLALPTEREGPRELTSPSAQRLWFLLPSSASALCWPPLLYPVGLELTLGWGPVGGAACPPSFRVLGRLAEVGRPQRGLVGSLQCSEFPPLGWWTHMWCQLRHRKAGRKGKYAPVNWGFSRRICWGVWTLRSWAKHHYSFDAPVKMFRRDPHLWVKSIQSSV